MATAPFFIILILPYPEKISSVSQVCLVIVVVMITWQWKYIDYRLLPISITLSRLLSVFAFSACWSESQLRFYYAVFCFVFFRQEHFICLCNIYHIYICVHIFYGHIRTHLLFVTLCILQLLPFANTLVYVTKTYEMLLMEKNKKNPKSVIKA